MTHATTDPLDGLMQAVITEREHTRGAAPHQRTGGSCNCKSPCDGLSSRRETGDEHDALAALTEKFRMLRRAFR